MKISFIRGDTYLFKFQRKNSDGTIITTQPSKMWFTVKKEYISKTSSIQKTLTNGIAFNSTDSTYHVTINNVDTRHLDYGDYVFDIQIKDNNQIKTIAKGTLTLQEEVTFEYE